MLMLGCNGIATGANAPEWAMDEDEAKKTGQPIANYLRHFDIPLTPKQLDGIVCAQAIGMAIVPRCIMSLARLRMEAAAKGRRVNPATNEAPAPVVVPNPIAPASPNAGGTTGAAPGAGFPPFQP